MSKTPHLPSTNYKLLVIVGPTASGKSELALKIAKKYGGEIIAADSRTIYKGMDIGTAKPTKEERAEVVHWGLDLIEPGQVYSAKTFKDYALNRIEDIQKRGKLPILVGGTGLYIDSVLFNFSFRPVGDSKERQKLEKLSIEQLQSLVTKRGLKMPENYKNKRYLVRTLEGGGAPAKKAVQPPKNVLIIGLQVQTDKLRRRISSRAERMFDKGVVEETKELITKYGEEALKDKGGIIYKVCLDILKGKVSQSEGIEHFKARDWQYARRQRTWFKRNPFILWHSGVESAEASVEKFLNTNY